MRTPCVRSAGFLLILACTGHASATTASIGIVKPETCGNSNGVLSASLSGGVIYQPLTYLWSNADTTQTITGLAAGSYSVTITDSQGTQFTANVTLNNVSGLPITGFESPSYVGVYDALGYTGFACAGMCNGALAMPMVELGGTAPFTTSFSVAASYIGDNSYGHPMYTGFCALDVVNYTLTDAFGCQGTGSFEVMQLDATAVPTIDNVEGACTGSDVGSITLNQWYGFCGIELSYIGTVIVPETILDEFNSITFDGLAAGTYMMEQWPMLGQCSSTQAIDVPDLGPGCTVVQGTSWYDQNADCVQDAGELGVPGSVLLIQPGSQYAITGSDGRYSFNLPTGSYTLEQTDPFLDPYCPTTVPVPFTVSGPATTIDLANNSTAPLDVRIHASTSNARPGFAHTVYAHALNATVQATGAVQVVATIDPAVTITGATPVPTFTAGNVLTWQLADLDYFADQAFTVETMVPIGTPLGTLLTHQSMVTSTNTDADLANNTAITTVVVTGGVDPNDKTVRSSTGLSGSQYFIGDDQWLDYTIRFQNTGTDTAFAVVITDTLDADLDMATFEQGVASHAFNVQFLPERTVKWTFNNILLPDSNTNEPLSHGLVSFRIRPVVPLLPGTELVNNADIFFDFNPAVRTNDALVVAELSTQVEEQGQGQASLWPNPARDAITIVGTDPPVTNVIVLAADGREVMRRSRGDTAIPVRSLAAGSYTVRALCADGNVISLRFVKQ